MSESGLFTRLPSPDDERNGLPSLSNFARPADKSVECYRPTSTHTHVHKRTQTHTRTLAWFWGL